MTMLHEIGGRLKELRKTHHYSQQDLSRELGLSQGMLSSIENRKSTISLSTLTKVCEIFKVNTEWLIYGRDMAGKQKLEHDFIPLVNKAATAGYIGRVEQPDALEQMGFYKIPGFTKGNFRLFEVNGDEMYPSLEKKDLAICEKIADSNSIEGGTLCVIVCANRLLVQRIYQDEKDAGTYILKSDNEIYKEQSLKKADIVEVWRIKSKITSSFVRTSLQRIERVEHLENEVRMLKDQFIQLTSRM